MKLFLSCLTPFFHSSYIFSPSSSPCLLIHVFNPIPLSIFDFLFLNIENFAEDDSSFYVRTVRNLGDLYRFAMAEREGRIPELFEFALEENPEHGDLLSYLAVYYQEGENFSKAVEYYERLLVVAPENAAARAELQKLRSQGY